jgi:hypothetical protein
MTTAFEAFYKYADERRKVARNGENATINADITSNAFAALRTLLALIGDVNGHKVSANDAMLNTLAGCSMVKFNPLAGEALTQESVVKNLKAQVDGIRNGTEEEYITRITNEYEVAKVRFAELKKLAGSCTTEHKRVSVNKFFCDIDAELATIINAQDAMSSQELEAIDKAKTAERDAKRKANKLAKKNAK